MIRTVLAAACMSLSLTAHAAGQGAPDLSVFAAHDDSSRMSVDYSVLSDLLHDIVLNVPRMDRNPERSRTITTGTRITTSNQTRYRYEANRVIYHAMSEEYEAALSAYRRELEALPSQIDFARLSRDEQLAYWFNLHNVAVIEQIMLRYPVTYVNRLNAGDTGEDLFEGRFLNVAGVPLSLNDIRLRIVFENWNDPRVIYGFFNGSIGGPEIQRNAFDGARVWRQLDASAAEFVNALRGVEVHSRILRVSHIYDDARRFFPDFGRDLRIHLGHYADAETVTQLVGDREIRTDVEVWNIADMANGSLRCTGPGGASPMMVVAPRRSRADEITVSTSLSCADLPSNGRVLMNAVQRRRIELLRQGRYGEVFTVDIPTEDTSASEPAQSESSVVQRGRSVLIQRGGAAPESGN